jgi:biopolymer transport protein ExbD
MKRTRYRPEIKKNQSFALNITSMTDMFTIMLVFLLQNFASGEVRIDNVAGLRLPTSSTDKNPVEGINLSLTKDELKLDRELIAHLTGHDFESASIDKEDSNFIRPLFIALQKLNTANPKDNKIGKALLQADQEIPYSVLRKVMYTASMAGFPNLKLVTLAGN